MFAKIIPLVVVAFLSTAIPSHGQESVCDLFSHLESADGRQLVLTGDLIISKEIAVLGAADCDNRYQTRLGDLTNFYQIWPVALLLHSSTAVTPARLMQFQEAAAEADRLRRAGKTVSASASFSGRLHLKASGDSPAEFTFDSFENLKVQALPDADTLRVIPICDLFQNLQAWKGKRIAVRGDFMSTMEGAWIISHCDGGFVTDGYRWPVSLNCGIPAYYSSETAGLYEPQSPSLSKSNRKGVLGDSSATITTATFVGLLRMKSEYTTRYLMNGTVVGNGFGHLNGAAAELIVDTILDPELATPPPMGASRSGNVEMVRVLLAAGAGEEDRLANGPAVGIVDQSGKLDMARLLSSAGKTAEAAEAEGKTMLMLAAASGLPNVVDEILKDHPDVNARDKNGRTALMEAVGRYHSGPEAPPVDRAWVARTLLEAGADANLRDKDGSTALIEAAWDSSAVLVLLQGGANINAQNNRGVTALMNCATPMVAWVLLANHADPSIRDADGKTALDLAKQYNMTGKEAVLLTRKKP